jgi:hypothetical protein
MFVKKNYFLKISKFEKWYILINYIEILFLVFFEKFNIKKNINSVKLTEVLQYAWHVICIYTNQQCHKVKNTTSNYVMTINSYFLVIPIRWTFLCRYSIYSYKQWLTTQLTWNLLKLTNNVIYTRWNNEVTHIDLVEYYLNICLMSIYP